MTSISIKKRLTAVVGRCVPSGDCVRNTVIFENCFQLMSRRWLGMWFAGEEPGLPNEVYRSALVEGGAQRRSAVGTQRHAAEKRTVCLD